MRKIIFTQTEITDILNLYVEQHIPTTKISKKYSCSVPTILRVLKENNVQIKDSRLITNESKTKIIDLYSKGISLTKMQEILKIDRNTISKILKENNIEVINHQNETKFNEHIFDVIDSEEKAYWLGFIFADGNISSNKNDSNKKSYKFELSLKASDSEHLVKFNTFMQHNKNNVKLGEVKNNNKTYYRCRWGVSNKHLWETLNNYGCTPNKSLTLSFPNENIFINKSLIFDFIRGYIDGDGCISYHATSKSKEFYSPNLSILGTEKFLNKIAALLNSNKIAVKDPRSSVYVLSFSVNETHELLDLLYTNSTIYLTRKFKRAMFFRDDCRSAKELAELLEGENGEGCNANPVISDETKESSTL